MVGLCGCCCCIVGETREECKLLDSAVDVQVDDNVGDDVVMERLRNGRPGLAVADSDRAWPFIVWTCPFLIQVSFNYDMTDLLMRCLSYLERRWWR